MGKLFYKSKLIRALCTAAAALAIAVAPVSEGMINAPAAATDYDAIIAEKEAEAERIQQENIQREAEIGELSDDIDDNEVKMALISDQIAGVNAEIETYGELITITQNKIIDKQIEIENIEATIGSKEQQISDKRVEINGLEQKNKENLGKFAQLIRALYMNDTSGTMPIFEGSDDWYSFFTYVDVVQEISSQNLAFMNGLLSDIHNQEDLIAGLNSDIEQLNTDKSTLTTKKKELETELADLETKKTEVEGIANTRYTELSNLSATNENLQAQVNTLRSEIDASNEEVEAINEAIKELIRAKQQENSGGPVYSSDGFRWPLDSDLKLITTYFGYDAWRGGNHYGIDVGNAGIGGRNIYAAQGGVVITAYNDSGWHGGFGNYVIIDHGGGLSTVYAHCRSVTVSAGQVVNKGDVIGYVGTTGWSTGNHLHFETRVNGTAVDPFGYSYEYV